MVAAVDWYGENLVGKGELGVNLVNRKWGHQIYTPNQQPAC